MKATVIKFNKFIIKMLEVTLIISSIISAAIIASRKSTTTKVGIVVVIGLFQLAVAGYSLYNSVEMNLYNKHDISRGTSSPEIKRMFRKLSREMHPDKIGTDSQ